jgi:hypothetical protein
MLPAPPDGALCGNPGAFVIGHDLWRPGKDFHRVARPLAGVLPARPERLRQSNPVGTCRR